jgi:lipoate-protein ligase A
LDGKERLYKPGKSKMKNGSATQKIPGGKLIRIDVQFSERIERIKITGDFFLDPEETLDRIEETLTGVPLPLDRPALSQRITDLLVEMHAELIGAAPEDIIATLAEAIQ